MKEIDVFQSEVEQSLQKNFGGSRLEELSLSWVDGFSGNFVVTVILRNRGLKQELEQPHG